MVSNHALCVLILERGTGARSNAVMGYATRRLTVANDEHADRRLTTQEIILAAATECYEVKVAMP